MIKVTFAAQMENYTGGVKEIEIDAKDYRQACQVLSARYPRLTEEVFAAFAVAIDDVLIQEPLLEALNPNSELIFIPRIMAG